MKRIAWQQYVGTDGSIYHWHPDDDPPGDGAHLLTPAQYDEICARQDEDARAVREQAYATATFGIPWQELYKRG